MKTPTLPAGTHVYIVDNCQTGTVACVDGKGPHGTTTYSVQVGNDLVRNVYNLELYIPKLPRVLDSTVAPEVVRETIYAYNTLLGGNYPDQLIKEITEPNTIWSNHVWILGYPNCSTGFLNFFRRTETGTGKLTTQLVVNDGDDSYISKDYPTEAALKAELQLFQANAPITMWQLVEDFGFTRE